MATVTFFYEDCPVCGRPLRVDVRFMGRWVLCSHCEGEFVAGQRQFPRPVAASDAATTSPTGGVPPVDSSLSPATPQRGCQSAG